MRDDPNNGCEGDYVAFYADIFLIRLAECVTSQKNVWVGGYWLRGDPKGLVCTKMAKKRYKAFKTNICSLKEAESEDQWVARTNA